MDTNKIKEIVYWWFEFLNGKQLDSREDRERFERIFGPLEEDQSIADEWQSMQRTCQRMWDYKEFDAYHRKSWVFISHAKRFCRHLECPVNKYLNDNGVDISPSDEDGIFNLIVGPNGNLNSGTPKDFVDVIMERLSLAGSVSEAYFHDPYAVKSLTNSQSQQFATDFINELQSRIAPLVVVTREDITQVPSSVKTPFKKIPSGVIHDRLLVVLDDGEWKGILIGSSINAFPAKANPKKAHFIITKTEQADAPLIAGIIQDNIK